MIAHTMQKTMQMQDDICGDVDECPYDAENDADHDNICGDVDECPYDTEIISNQDGICGDVDECPYDAENDADLDGICGDVDECPYDAENDADYDGYCADFDNTARIILIINVDGDGVSDSPCQSCGTIDCMSSIYGNTGRISWRY